MRILGYFLAVSGQRFDAQKFHQCALAAGVNGYCGDAHELERKFGGDTTADLTGNAWLSPAEEIADNCDRFFANRSLPVRDLLLESQAAIVAIRQFVQRLRVRLPPVSDYGSQSRMELRVIATTEDGSAVQVIPELHDLELTVKMQTNPAMVYGWRRQQDI